MTGVGGKAALIGLDWGTTSLRAYLLDGDGAILDRYNSALGILANHQDGFSGTFRQVAGHWLDAHPGLPVIASGMITSRNGWVETPYARVPAGIDALADSLTALDIAPDCRIHFVCGMDQDLTGGMPDIMRGEETQIAGCIAGGTREGLFVMPGTHSKWVRVDAANLVRFDSYMTGEVFAVLKAHSILGRLMEGHGTDLTEGFQAGVQARFASDASLLNQIFSTRTMVLYDRLPPGQAADYLSGLLIGEEVKAATQGDNELAGETAQVTIVGSGELTDRYRQALALVGIAAGPAQEDASAKGHHAIALRAGLIG